jgi:molybdopterin converting factor subunit 1
MKVRVRLFAFMAQAAGKREVELDVPPGATFEEVKRLLKVHAPGLRWPGNVMWAINQEYVPGDGRSAGLKEGDEVAIIPPVSGG